MSDHEYSIEDGGRAYTLDATVKCAIEGCEWHIKADAIRCVEHGGPPEGTLYVTSETGETIYSVDLETPLADDGDPIV